MLMPSFLSSSSQLNDGEGLLSVQRINSSLTGGRRPACGLAFPPCTARFRNCLDINPVAYGRTTLCTSKILSWTFRPYLVLRS